jgi:phage baseplate assembly protein W
MSTYRGFSTAQSLKKYHLTDFELAKQDLINYFNIRKGEKLMQPRFGTIIWDMLFEPLDDGTQETITADITRIVNYDPRLRVNQISVTQQTQGLQISLNLTYVPTDQTTSLLLNFNQHAQTLTTN